VSEPGLSREPMRRRPEPISEIDILWITAGLGCDGDTIAMTAATQPSIEEILLGAIPWIPKVTLHNPFLTYDNGEEFMQHFHAAAAGKLSPFILVIEGSIFFWNGPRNRSANSHLRLDRSAGAACLGRDSGRNLRDLRWNPCDGRQSDRLHGTA
jgi:Ni,Fe-hydrogenase I small subunit